LLARINHELVANFNLNKFEHRAIFNAEEARIEMHLISHDEQHVRISDEVVHFKKGESIHTENSHKYTVESFQKMAEEAGLKPIRAWCDTRKLFSLHYLSC